MYSWVWAWNWEKEPELKWYQKSCQRKKGMQARSSINHTKTHSYKDSFEGYFPQGPQNHLPDNSIQTYDIGFQNSKQQANSSNSLPISTTEQEDSFPFLKHDMSPATSNFHNSPKEHLRHSPCKSRKLSSTIQTKDFFLSKLSLSPKFW